MCFGRQAKFRQIRCAQLRYGKPHFHVKSTTLLVITIAGVYNFTCMYDMLVLRTDALCVPSNRLYFLVQLDTQADVRQKLQRNSK